MRNIFFSPLVPSFFIEGSLFTFQFLNETRGEKKQIFRTQEKVNQEDIDDEQDSKPLIQVRSQNRSNRKLKQLNAELKQRNLTTAQASDKSDKLDTDSKVKADKKTNVANAEKQPNVEKDKSDIISKETDQSK